MRNFVGHKNIGLLFSRMTKGKPFSHVFVTTNVSETIFLSPLTGTNAFNGPLYIYDEDGNKSSNLKKEIVTEIKKVVGEISPEDIFHYIYAILHSQNYRDRFQEFLKNDFPHIPYPKNKKQFTSSADLGRELCELHLLESPKVSKTITTYPETGSNMVDKVNYKDGNLYINPSQYFGGVTQEAWDLSVGGYQPAQKWLKDRKARILTNDEIEHYQKMIVALTETARIMKEIDRISG
jgi:predicted helicase